jgi:hypothetical protein
MDISALMMLVVSSPETTPAKLIGLLLPLDELPPRRLLSALLIELTDIQLETFPY